MADRALLIRLGALGDTLQASSAAVLLKKHVPRLEVDFLAAAGLTGLFGIIPSVATAFGLPFRKIPFGCHPWWAALSRRLNERAYGLAYLMETNPRFLPLLDGIRADRKIALTAPKAESEPAPALPNPVRYQKPLWEAGLVPRDVCSPELVVGREEEGRADALLASLGLDPDATLVGLHPGNSFQARSVWRKKLRRSDLRSWPEDRWEALALRMHRENGGLQFVLFGGPRDRRGNSRIAGRLRRIAPDIRLADTAGKTDLPLAAALLRRFSLFISTDTGPLHMAAALRVPFVGLYGPTRFEETSPFPADAPGAVLRHALPCQPCYGTRGQKRCRENVCMRAIEAGEAVEKAREVSPSLFSVHNLPVGAGGEDSQ
jgi:ADP-heptose:LPS heptosyltransferase